MRSLPPPRLLPWSSWSEWAIVYSCLESYLSSGVGSSYPKELIAFNERCLLRGRAPFAITLTLQLLQVLREVSLPRVCESALGLLLIRLVNSVADSGQTGVFATSVAELARRVGLPRWLVDLRHDLTHGQQPEGRVLRLAAGHAVEWLMGHYWRPQALTLARLGGGEDAPQIFLLLEQYWRQEDEGEVVESRIEEVAHGGKGVRGVGGQNAGLNKNGCKRSRGASASHTPKPPQSSIRTAGMGSRVSSGPHLVPFSPCLIKKVMVACNGEVERLIMYGSCGGMMKEGDSALIPVSSTIFSWRIPEHRRDCIPSQTSAPNSSSVVATILTLLSKGAASRCKSILCALAAGVAPPWHRHLWLSNVLMQPLVCEPGFLLKPPPPNVGAGFVSVNGKYSFLPTRHAPALSSFALWAPLLYSLERVLPGTVRLLLRCLLVERSRLLQRAASAHNHGQEGQQEATQCLSMLESWIWLFNTRYWASLFDWGLSVAPNVAMRKSNDMVATTAASKSTNFVTGRRVGGNKARRGGKGDCRGSGDASSAAATAAAALAKLQNPIKSHVLLHAQNVWSHAQCSWAFSSAPASYSLGLFSAPSPDGRSKSLLCLSLHQAYSHFHASSSPPPLYYPPSAKPLNWEEFVILPWYQSALRSPVAAALCAAAGTTSAQQPPPLQTGGGATRLAPLLVQQDAVEVVSPCDPDLEELERMLGFKAQEEMEEEACSHSKLPQTEGQVNAPPPPPPPTLPAVLSQEAPRWFI